MYLQVIQTPGGIKSTDKLNHLAGALESNSFYKYVDSSKTGFDIDFDAKWAYLLYFNNKSGFMAIKEIGNCVKIWSYKHDEDLDPVIFIVNDYKVEHVSKLINLIKGLYREVIQ